MPKKKRKKEKLDFVHDYKLFTLYVQKKLIHNLIWRVYLKEKKRKKYLWIVKNKKKSKGNEKSSIAYFYKIRFFSNLR